MNKPIIQKHKYKFRAYSKEFPKLYKKERAKLLKITPNARIEHVGSTSIEGLGGKGIIDISIGVPKREIKKDMTKLEKIGFEYRPHKPDNTRKFFQKIINYDSKERRVHLHLSAYNSKFEKSFFLFRDYLKTHKKERKQYTKVKREAVKHAKGWGEKYRQYKEGFIANIVKKALNEQRRTAK